MVHIDVNEKKTCLSVIITSDESVLLVCANRLENNPAPSTKEDWGAGLAPLMLM